MRKACAVARRSGFTREEAGPCWPISTRRSPSPPPPHSRVNPLLRRSVVDTQRWLDTDRRVGAGSPAKRPALLANLHPSFTVVATTVFAGKPAPTPDQWWTQVGGWAQAVVGAGLPAKGPALLANLHPPFTVSAATAFAGKPAPTPDQWWTQVGGWAQAVVGAGLPAKGPALLANLHPSFTVSIATVFAGKPAGLDQSNDNG